MEVQLKYQQWQQEQQQLVEQENQLRLLMENENQQRLLKQQELKAKQQQRGGGISSTTSSSSGVSLHPEAQPYIPQLKQQPQPQQHQQQQQFPQEPSRYYPSQLWVPLPDDDLQGEDLAAGGMWMGAEDNGGGWNGAAYVSMPLPNGAGDQYPRWPTAETPYYY